MMRQCFFCVALLACLPLSAPSESTPTPATNTPAPLEAEARAAPPGPLAGETVPEEEPPEGYYAFVESPNATPPRVRPPPYRQTNAECTEAHDPRPHVTAHNLCGDLNRGVIPNNPMGHRLNGEPYPFELLRNLTLRFLSRTLPVLRADDTLPRVKHIAQPVAPAEAQMFQDSNRLQRHKRSAAPPSPATPEPPAPRALTGEEPREKRFCENGGVRIF